MKRVISCVLALIIILVSVPCVSSAEVSVSASSAVLYCPDNQKVYYSKNENTKAKMASTTKIMTALLTLEYAAKNNKKVKFTRDMIAEGSSMYLKVGEVVTLRDLAAGLLLCSGNDAANAAAITIAGSLEKFAELMNKRAKQIGMKNTNFVTPSGLDHDDHYSTAYDMALLMAVALENKDFAEITAMKTATVNFIKPKDKSTTYSNHNRLLSLYEYCIGGKTGYTMAAGRCLVTASKKDGLTLICVTLNDKRDWNDHISMYNYGYENYCMKSLDDRDFYLDVDTVGGESESTTVGSDDSTDIVLPVDDADKVKREIFLDNFIYAPVKDGDKAGFIKYTLNGKQIAKHNLIAMSYNNSVEEDKNIWDYIKGFFDNAF